MKIAGGSMQIVSPSYIEERDGELYAGTTRVTVRSIILGWTHRGYTPEQIVQSYPSVSLEEVYGVIAYYLGHRADLDERFACEHDAFEHARQEQNARVDGTVAEVRQRIQTLRAESTIDSNAYGDDGSESFS